MNMQQLMQQAKKMQADIEKKQKELEGSTYEGKSSFVDVVINGKKEIIKININIEEDITADDKEMLEDMIMVAINDAIKKVDKDIEDKFGAYGKGMPGLF